MIAAIVLAVALAQEPAAVGAHEALVAAAGMLEKCAAAQEAGDLAAARARLADAVGVLAPFADVDVVAALLDGMQDHALELGDPAVARDALLLVLRHRERSLPEDHADLLTTQRDLAAVLFELGDLAGARALEEKVLATCERLLDADHAEVQDARQNLAATLFELGDLDGARSLEERVLAVRSRTLADEDPDLQLARSNLACTLFALDDLESALVLQEKVLAVAAATLPEDDPELAQARQNLALTLQSLGHVGRARVLEEQVLAIRERTLPEDHADVQAARQNLAVTLKLYGDVERARALEQRVLEVRSRALPDDHPDLQAARGNLAFTLARGGPEGEAEFAELATTFTRALRRGAAATWLSASRREAEERLADTSLNLSRALSFAFGVGRFGAREDLLREVFLASECMRSAAVVSSRLARAAHGRPGHDEALAAARQAHEDVARAVQGSGEDGELSRALARRDAAERALVALAAQAGAQDIHAAELDVADLAAALPSDGAAVCFRRFKRMDRERYELCAFVLRSDGALASVDLGPIAPIEEAAQGWRDALGISVDRSSAPDVASRTDAARAAAERLRALVVDPLLPALEGAARVTLVLDDVLHTVPLDALPLPDGEKLLGERFAIDHRLTLIAAPSFPAERDADVGLLALGAPAFNSSVGASESAAAAWERSFEPLPYSGSEARGVAALFEEALAADTGRVVLLEKTDASRANVESIAPAARFLHLATHGWYAPESVRSLADADTAWLDARLGLRGRSAAQRVAGSSPMVLCGLALAGANLPPDALGRYAGLVTAEEIAGWDLSNCELAVLSACHTNVGMRRAGQGVASLQKALALAGARSAITSIWKVPDEATKDLMLDFYRRLWVEKKPTARALWEAKMRLRAARDDDGRARFTTRDWAAWVLTGG